MPDYEKQNLIKKVDDFQRIFFPNWEFPKTPTPIYDKKIAKLRVSLLQEELNELAEALEQEDIIEIADAIIDINYLLLGTALYAGLQNHFEDIFNEVHRSNMTKLPIDGKIIYREDGKILKPKNFEPPNIMNILYPALEFGKTYRFKEGECKDINFKLNRILPEEECYKLDAEQVKLDKNKNAVVCVSVTLHKNELWKIYEYAK